MCGDTKRFCLNCQKMSRWHNFGTRAGGHSQCRKCNFPSLWGVKCPKGKAKPDDRIIEERAMELGYMMRGAVVHV